MMGKAKATARRGVSQLCGTAVRLWWLKLGLVLVLVVISIFGEANMKMKVFNVEFQSRTAEPQGSLDVLALAATPSHGPYIPDVDYRRITVTCSAEGGGSQTLATNSTISGWPYAASPSPATYVRPCDTCGVWISLSCSVTSDAANTVTTPVLHMAGKCPPTITSFEVIETGRRRDHSLRCQTGGQPTPHNLTITREPSTVPLAASTPGQLGHVEYRFEHYDCSVTGLYRCDAGLLQKTIAVIKQHCPPVWCPNQPTFVRTWDDQTTTLDLCVIISSQRSIDTQWHRNGLPYDGVGQPKVRLMYVSPNLYRIQVSLLNVDGVWGLKVIYDIGNIQISSTPHNFLVRLEGPPLCPTNVRSTQLGSTQVKLSWTPAYHDGDIYRYIIFYNLSHDRHVMLDYNDSRRSWVVVSDLQPNTTYLFQIIAFNTHSCDLDEARHVCPEAGVLVTTEAVERQHSGCAINTLLTIFLVTLILVVVVSSILVIFPDVVVKRCIAIRMNDFESDDTSLNFDDRVDEGTASAIASTSL